LSLSTQQIMKDNKKRSSPGFSDKYDDDDSSSSSSSSNEVLEANNDAVSRRKQPQKQQLNDEDSNTNDDDDESDDYSKDEDEEQQIMVNRDQEDESMSEVDENYDDRTLPIGERIQRLNESSFDIKKRRQLKKSIALKVDRDSNKSFKDSAERTKKSDTILDSDNDEPQSKKKKSKHAPTEVSSKRSDFYRNQKHNKYDMNENGIGVSINSKQFKSIDPRAVSLTGHFNEDNYEKQYNFINDVRKKEIDTIKQQISAVRTSGRKGQRHRKQLNVSVTSLDELQTKLQSLQQEQATVERNSINRLAKQNVQQKLKENVATGKAGIYFPKRSDMKQMEYQTKLDIIRKQDGDGAVTKMLAKRRKKNKSRDASNFVRTTNTNTSTDGKKKQRKFY
jgi:ribosomal RNA-processing protein 36